MGFKKTIRYTKYHKISPYAYTSDEICIRHLCGFLASDTTLEIIRHGKNVERGACGEAGFHYPEKYLEILGYMLHFNMITAMAIAVIVLKTIAIIAIIFATRELNRALRLIDSIRDSCSSRASASFTATRPETKS